MLSSALQTSTIPVLEQVLNFAQSRHKVLASNLANIDTPGYRTKDMSPDAFQARLKEAVDERNKAGQPVSMASWSEGDPVAKVGTTLDGILYHDQNNRGLEQQVAAIADNELVHNTALAIMASQFKLLDAAVSEKV
jgi:flagellar basal-body rod protein FlgB